MLHAPPIPYDTMPHRPRSFLTAGKLHERACTSPTTSPGEVPSIVCNGFQPLVTKKYWPTNQRPDELLPTSPLQATDSPQLVTKAFEEAPEVEACPPTKAARDRADGVAEEMGESGEGEDCPICMEAIEIQSGAVTGCAHLFCRCAFSDLHQPALV